MTILSSAERTLLDAGIARHDALEMLHKAGQRDAEALRRLIGQRCRKRQTEYEITDIRYGWNGFIHARGYRILVKGKRGSRVWDIGQLTSDAFNDT